jgi:hypothetical protein
LFSILSESFFNDFVRKYVIENNFPDEIFKIFEYREEIFSSVLCNLKDFSDNAFSFYIKREEN